MGLERAGVVGAGTMGGGIAYVFAAAGLDVLVKDIEGGQLDVARAHVERILERRVARGGATAAEASEQLTRVRYTLSYEGFGALDLAIEAVPEDMQVKRAVFAELDAVCAADAILSSNTSALSITEMGRATGRPQQVVGMHFFNPAHVMKLVEVIPGADTAPGVVEAIANLAGSLGKTAVVVRECPGFLVNRVLMPYLNEAAICLQEGASTAHEIDAAMGRDGFGWPMGPFALMDMLGLDVCHHIMRYLDGAFGDRFSEAALVEALLRAGRLGQKAGRGFYDHPGCAPSAEVEDLIRSLAAAGQVAHAGSAFSPERLMAALLNEAFLCAGEEIASEADIDTACVLGLGMAVAVDGGRVPMGPMRYASRVGLDVVLDQLRTLEATLGPSFAPAPLLTRRASEGPHLVQTGREEP